MRQSVRPVFWISAVFAGMSVICAVWAGPLDPPAGPIAPTPGPEPRTAINAANTPGDADSVFKITQSGSYYLTGNVTGVATKHGIEIASSGVTLDLNGFDLVGVAGSLDGVSVTAASLTNIAVVNGSVRNWGDEGVDLGTFAAVACRVAGVVAGGNVGHGISTGSGCVVTDCAARSNAGSGISVASGCTVTNCSVEFNTSDGIGTITGCTVSNCSAASNGLFGIGTSSGCTVTSCSAQANTLHGINTGIGCTVTNCSSNSNTGSGIFVTAGSTVAGCTARLNTLDGIACTVGSVIRGNTCSNNGNGAGDGAGIHASGADNRIEDNNCTAADRGIDVDVAGNTIVRNTCAGNTIDWVIATNNVFGPIIDRRAPASAAVSGFSAASTLGSTDANANFSY